MRMRTVHPHKMPFYMMRKRKKEKKSSIGGNCATYVAVLHLTWRCFENEGEIHGDLVDCTRNAACIAPCVTEQAQAFKLLRSMKIFPRNILAGANRPRTSIPPFLPRYLPLQRSSHSPLPNARRTTSPAQVLARLGPFVPFRTGANGAAFYHFHPIVLLVAHFPPFSAFLLPFWCFPLCLALVRCALWVVIPPQLFSTTDQPPSPTVRANTDWFLHSPYLRYFLLLPRRPHRTSLFPSVPRPRKIRQGQP